MWAGAGSAEAVRPLPPEPRFALPDPQPLLEAEDSEEAAGTDATPQLSHLWDVPPPASPDTSPSYRPLGLGLLGGH